MKTPWSMLAGIWRVAAGFLMTGCEDDDYAVSWCWHADGVSVCGAEGCVGCRDHGHACSSCDCDTCR
jgi:hypothetical protein